MQISRLFQIVYILLEKGTTTANELAERFEVSARTIYRDVEALSQAGIPIYASQGKGGGISLADRFILNKSLLSEQEQEEILLALQSLSAARLPESNQVLTKLSSLFKKNNANWIEVDFSSWGGGEWQKELFSLLKHAILNRRIISFSYYGVSGEKSSRKAAPMKLLFKDKAWYFQGYCLDRMAMRTFKITRMSEVCIIGDAGDVGDAQARTRAQVQTYPPAEHTAFVPSADVPSGMPPSASSASSANSSSMALSPQKNDTPRTGLNLKISAAGAYRVYDDFKERDITKHEDGSFTITTTMPEGEWIYNYLLSFGTVLEVIEPQSIRREIKTRITNMAEKYSIKPDGLLSS